MNGNFKCYYCTKTEIGSIYENRSHTFIFSFKIFATSSVDLTKDEDPDNSTSNFCSYHSERRGH